jgi:predicted ATPase
VYEQFISRNELGLISRLTWKEVQLSSNVAEVKSGGTFKKVRKYKTLIIPKIQIGQSHITFNQLSEGTFKTLAMVFYIMTDASSCLLIEEPEVCVHLGLLSRIVSTIKSYSKSKQVIFSTHSDQVLDQLDPKNVFVVAMTRTGTTAVGMESWVGQKGRVALTNYLEESGTLGEYWRAGGLA